MARCSNCPAIDEYGIVDEFYVFGKGCPDTDMDCYGGDCYSSHNFEDCPECGGKDCLEYIKCGEPDDYYDDSNIMIWCKICERPII